VVNTCLERNLVGQMRAMDKQSGAGMIFGLMRDEVLTAVFKNLKPQPMN
jgi:hypothetical protein